MCLHRAFFKQHKLQFMKELNNVVFFVEATSYEALCLWEELNHKCKWEQCMGYSFHIGNVKDDPDMPIQVSFMINKIYGKEVAFYEATSRYVDHTMVENWIKKHHPVKYDNGTRWAITDAMNFPF